MRKSHAHPACRSLPVWLIPFPFSPVCDTRMIIFPLPFAQVHFGQHLLCVMMRLNSVVSAHSSAVSQLHNSCMKMLTSRAATFMGGKVMGSPDDAGDKTHATILYMNAVCFSCCAVACIKQVLTNNEYLVLFPFFLFFTSRLQRLSHSCAHKQQISCVRASLSLTLARTN